LAVGIKYYGNFYQQNHGITHIIANYSTGIRMPNRSVQQNVSWRQTWFMGQDYTLMRRKLSTWLKAWWSWNNG